MNPTSVADMVPLNVSVSHPTQEKLSGAAQAALDLVRAFDIVDDATYQIGADELAGIKGRAARLEEQRKSITRPMDEAKSAVMALFRGPLEVLGAAETELKGKMLAYSREQARLAEVARREAEAAARAERERQAAQAAELLAQAEQQRAAALAAAQAQAQAQAQPDGQQAEGDAGSLEQMQCRAAEAAAEADRLRLDAESRLLAAQMVVAAPVAAAPPKASGVSVRQSYVFQVVDKLALIRHVAAHPELIHLLVEDTTRLRAYVRGLGAACQLPGVDVRTESSISSRRS